MLHAFYVLFMCFLYVKKKEYKTLYSDVFLLYLSITVIRQLNFFKGRE